MLSVPGLRFHRALAPFLQRVVGSVHLAVGGVLGYTFFFFFIVVFLSSCVAFYFYYFC